jgi:hypothetical protein
MRASRNVKDGCGELTGNLVHVGDHQQQALGSGKGGGEGTGLQCAVYRTSRTTFGLHFYNQRRGAPKC